MVPEVQIKPGQPSAWGAQGPAQGLPGRPHPLMLASLSGMDPGGWGRQFPLGSLGSAHEINIPPR